MHREILETVESERAQVEELNLRFTRAVLAAEKIAIQKEIETIKLGGQVRILEIQLRYARDSGRSEVVSQLEAALELMKNPVLPSSEKPLPGK